MLFKRDNSSLSILTGLLVRDSKIVDMLIVCHAKHVWLKRNMLASNMPWSCHFPHWKRQKTLHGSHCYGKSIRDMVSNHLDILFHQPFIFVFFSFWVTVSQSPGLASCGTWSTRWFSPSAPGTTTSPGSYVARCKPCCSRAQSAAFSYSRRLKTSKNWCCFSKLIGKLRD